MESLNLHTLASSLPTSQQNAEKELANNFKAAALSLTNLYRTSRQNSKRTYNSGYAAACQDLLTMIQQGVSLDQSVSGDDAESGLTIGRVMDWIEARLEAIKSRQEEEDEDEERERDKEKDKDKDKERGRVAPVAPLVTATPCSVASKSVPKAQSTTVAGEVQSKDQQPRPMLLTPSSPVSHLNPQLSSEPPSPSQPLRSRSTRSRFQPKPDPNPSAVPTTVESLTTHPSSLAPPPNPSLSDIPIPIAAGAKRRHTMMMMLDPPSPPVTINGGPSAAVSAGFGLGNNLVGLGGNQGSASLAGRRRTRSSRNTTLQQQTPMAHAPSEAMDIEEDGGRERKRVARW